MKGCARSCLLLLLGWGAASFAFYSYFVKLRDFGSPMYWASIVAGLFVISVLAYARGIGVAYRERKMLLDALAGTPPVDGRWSAVSGTIRATTPLTAPFSGAYVVAYEYKIHRHERHGNESSEVEYYEGKALAPSTINTRQGSVRLLSVPVMTEIDEESIPSAMALVNANAYIARTNFTPRDDIKKRRAGLAAEWTDDDGEFRIDKRDARQPDLDETFTFDEKHIKQGEHVCAFGLYSAERRGLIPHPNWAKQTRVVRGDATKVADQLRRKMIRYVAGMVIFSALVYGIVWLYQYKAATLP